MEKFTRAILDSASKFGRWWDGFCIVFEEINNEETGEKLIPYTF